MKQILKIIRKKKTFFSLILGCILLITVSINKLNAQPMTTAEISEKIVNIEKKWENSYESFFQRDFKSFSLTALDIEKKITKLSEDTGQQTAVIWIATEAEKLTLFLITPHQQPIVKVIEEASSKQVIQLSRKYREELNNYFLHPKSNYYLQISQKLYQWLIKPLEQELQEQKIDTIMFCIGPGLRTLPFAALHDGEQFLIEKYNLTRISAFNLTPFDNKKNIETKVLAMGSSEFKNHNPLPGVETELKIITSNLWEGISILNEDFTLSNLKFLLQQGIFQIVHLATHADFRANSPEQSYIQLSDAKLNLDEIAKLDWQKSPVELLVLSACNTAIGDQKSEFGFAGLSIQAGVKSALASLWEVSDVGTLALMSQFYQQLKINPITAEALRQAQIAMLRGRVRLEEGELRNSTINIPLPPALVKEENINLSHPYYWSGFSLIGNPF